MKVLSLFSGIGAFEMALRNIGIDYELVGFSEIDKNAIKSYCEIHNVGMDKHIGDIRDIEIEKLPNDIDLLTHGSPCTNFSRAGKFNGGEKGSGTQSSLMWNTVEIVKNKKPKIVLWENVPDITSPKHRPVFEEYLKELESVGYVNSYENLVAKDFGIPQNRKRIFVVSILNGHKIEFPQKKELKKTVLDFLEDSVDERYYVENNFEKVDNEYRVINGTKKGYISFTPPAVFDMSYPKSKLRRGRVQGNGMICPTLTASKQSILYMDKNERVRYLTEKERWRLMGFSDEDFEKASNVSSNSAIYKQTGNSICLNVLEELFKVLYKECIDNE